MAASRTSRPRARRWPRSSRSRVENVEAALREVVEQQGLKPGKVFQPVRVAIAGTTVSPGIFESVALLGRDETLARIDAALEHADYASRLNEHRMSADNAG